MESIFKHTNVFDSSDPQPGWLFDIKFESDAAGASEILNDLIAISISLPTYETVTVERFFMGTSKSVAINRKYAGETDMEFYIRTEGENNFQLFSNLSKLSQKRFGFQHLEFDTTFDKIILTLYDKTGQENCKYIYYNCIITAFNLGDISYESEDMIKCTLSFHYDFWNKE